jgi:hypothetical protein
MRSAQAAPGSCARDWRGAQQPHLPGIFFPKGTCDSRLVTVKSPPRQVGPERESAEPRKARSALAPDAPKVTNH